MTSRKRRWFGLGLVATAGAGLLSLSAMMNSAFAHADDTGLVMGGSGLPIPGPNYVGAADHLYLDNPFTHLYPGLTFYQATPTNPFGNGLFTPEGLYPLTGVHTLPLNYPLNADGLPALSTSVGQGATILASTVQADMAAGNASTVFGYSQSSTLSGIAMQLLDPTGTPHTGPLDPQFLLIADPSAPNGGLLERFNGFETTTGQTVVEPLSLPSVGISFDGATPSDDFITNMYSLEYDGFTDFPRYPLNFLADLNAFLGIQTLHGTYLNGGVDGSGPTAQEIASAILLPGSMDSPTDPCAACLTNYHMILETPPLVAMLPKPLQDLLGPDLTTLINLGYGGDNLGYSDAPANIPTPFGLFPDVNPTTLMTELEQGWQSGLTAFEADLTNPAAWALPSTLSDASTAIAADPAAAPTFTEIINAISSAASTAYSTLLPLTDIGNFLVTSLPAYDLTLFTDNIQTGDLIDAFGLPMAANTAINTLAAGFAVEIIQSAASQISADFSNIGF